jgi:hypothetical protein
MTSRLCSCRHNIGRGLLPVTSVPYPEGTKNPWSLTVRMHGARLRLEPVTSEIQPRSDTVPLRRHNLCSCISTVVRRFVFILYFLSLLAFSNLRKDCT